MTLVCKYSIHLTHPLLGGAFGYATISMAYMVRRLNISTPAVVSSQS